jgi:hypothetical protein
MITIDTVEGKYGNIQPIIYISCQYEHVVIQIKKLRGLSPRANYTDRVTAPCWRS